MKTFGQVNKKLGPAPGGLEGALPGKPPEVLVHLLHGDSAYGCHYKNLCSWCESLIHTDFHIQEKRKKTFGETLP